MLKLEYLRYHHNDSNRGVIDRAGTDMAYRYSLRLPIQYGLPDPSSLCVFRGRLGKDGYLVDISMDADSELITEINVLPANGNEAADAVDLICQEEAAHGNDVETFSIVGAGNDGALLRELEDPAGLNVDAYVPPPQPPDSGLFTPQDFTPAAVTLASKPSRRTYFRTPQFSKPNGHPTKQTHAAS